MTILNKPVFHSFIMVLNSPPIDELGNVKVSECGGGRGRGRQMQYKVGGNPGATLEAGTTPAGSR